MPVSPCHKVVPTAYSLPSTAGTSCISLCATLPRESNTAECCNDSTDVLCKHRNECMFFATRKVLCKASQQCGLYGPPCGKVSSVDSMVRLAAVSSVDSMVRLAGKSTVWTVWSALRQSAVWKVWSDVRESQQCGQYGPPCGKDVLTAWLCKVAPTSCLSLARKQKCRIATLT